MTDSRFIDRLEALAEVLEVDAEEILESPYRDETFEVNGGEYLVVTEEEANILWDESLENYIEDCIVPELPEAFRGYFDYEAWKRDARFDGRGHSLASYDGEELEADNGMVIFRIN